MRHTCVICLMETGGDLYEDESSDEEGFDLVKLDNCGHIFHRDCILQGFEHSPVCPICKTGYGIVRGYQPDGTMSVDTLTGPNNRCKGYDRCDTFKITYTIPGGIQAANDPNPGSKYSGTSRQAYLPANEEGRVVLVLLKVAFMRGLIFTIGTSLSSGRENTVIWNGIHHKTSNREGPHGYPDFEYLGRVKDELKERGVAPE